MRRPKPVLWCRKACLFHAFAASLAYGRDMTLLEDSLPRKSEGNSGQKWCLLQSTKSAISKHVLQPISIRASDPKWFDPLAIRHALVLIWDRTIRLSCQHYVAILLLFVLGFATIMPAARWLFEDRHVEREMFNQSQHEKGAMDSRSRSPGAFGHLHFNPCGGISKIATIMDTDRPKLKRPVKMAVRTWGILFNVFMLVYQDIDLLHGSMAFYQGAPTSQLPPNMKRYIEFTNNMSLVSVRHATSVALAELLGLSATITWMFYRLGVFAACRNGEKTKYDAFIAIYDFFDCLNHLSDFSALRLLNLAHPSTLVRKLQIFMVKPFIGDSTHAHSYMRAQLCYFFVTRVVAVMLGVLAFGVKLAFASVQVTMPLHEQSGWVLHFLMSWSVVVTLLVQTLGAIAIEHMMKWRITLLIIEGGTRHVTLPKLQSSNVYTAEVMHAIYQEFYCTGKYLRFWTIMMTFDHIDLQWLLIDESKSPEASAEPSEDNAAASEASEVLEAIGEPDSEPG